MRVYDICSDGSPAEIARLDSLETVTISPEMEKSLPDDGLRTLCPDIDFSINSEIDSETMRRAFEITDAPMAAASEAGITLEQLRRVAAGTGLPLSKAAEALASLAALARAAAEITDELRQETEERRSRWGI